MKARSFMNSGFKSSRFKEVEEADPRIGLVNLADVMLVFACGLMVALVAHYNVDISGTAVEIEGEPQEIDASQFNEMENENEGDGGPALEERGTVWEDPTTGQMYLIEKVPEGEAQDWDQSDSQYGQSGTQDNAD